MYIKVNLLYVLEWLMKKCSDEVLMKLIRLRRKRTRKHLKRKYIRQNHLFYKKSIYARQREFCKKAFVEIKAPSRFDLINNPEETMAFFEEIEKNIVISPIRIIMKDVSILSVNALLYLIAIMQNTKARGKIFHIEGDLPENDFCRNTFEKSGFLSYVRSKKVQLNIDSSILKISSSEKHDSEIIKKLCIFVAEKFEISRQETKTLFAVLTELIQNTIGHAYPKTNSLYSCNKRNKDSWFLFARYQDELNTIEIAFLDTGVGIPRTVKRNFTDILRTLSDKSDANLIQSALEGEFRTETKKRTRGKGLPSIYEKYKQGKLEELAIISNKGYIKGEERKRLPAKFSGTLFSWKIRK